MLSDKKKAELKSFGKPDEVRTFPKGKVELVKIGGAMVGRATFEPGWKWSTSVKPLVKTKSCEAPHFQYQVSGILHIVMDDGTEFDSRAGDVTLLPVGHDAWVVGNEPAVFVDFQGCSTTPRRNENRANDLPWPTAPQNTALFTCLPSTRGEALRPSPLPFPRPVRAGLPFSPVRLPFFQRCQTIPRSPR